MKAEIPVHVSPWERPGTLSTVHPDSDAGVPVLIDPETDETYSPGDTLVKGITVNPISPVSGWISSPVWRAWEEGIRIARAALGSVLSNAGQGETSKFPHHCLRCGYDWIGIFANPKVCPKCKTPYWHTKKRLSTGPPRKIVAQG